MTGQIKVNSKLLIHTHLLVLLDHALSKLVCELLSDALARYRRQIHPWSLQDGSYLGVEDGRRRCVHGGRLYLKQGWLCL